MTEPDSVRLLQNLPQIGSYRLTAPLGSGGMSSVFRAVHIETGLEVALKILPRSLAKNPTLLHRFLREARSAESLQHPNIAAIFDRGSEAGRHYLVLEFVDGGDVHDRIRRLGPLPIDETVRIIREVAEALKYAAGQGVIHRDIKPANILLGRDGRVKLADLGLAIQASDEDERVTRDGTTVGTVDYMSPEQARDSRATSFKSDIYSLGCTAYYMLAGKPPFVGGDLAEKLRCHVQVPAPDIRHLRPEVPNRLAELILRMMAKRADQRPEGYAALASELDAIDLGAPSGPMLMAKVADDPDSAPEFLDEGDPTPDDETRDMRVARRESRGPESRFPEIGASILSEGDEGSAPAVRRPPNLRPHHAASGPGPAVAAMLESDEPTDEMPIAPRPVTSYDDDSLKVWILRGLFVGVIIAMIGIGLRQLLILSRPAEPESASVASSTDLTPPDDIPAPPVVAAPPTPLRTPTPEPSVDLTPPPVVPISSPKPTPAEPPPVAGGTSPSGPVRVPSTPELRPF